MDGEISEWSTATENKEGVVYHNKFGGKVFRETTKCFLRF